MTMQYKWYDIFVEWGHYHAVNHTTLHEIHNKIKSYNQMKRAIDTYLRNSH